MPFNQVENHFEPFLRSIDCEVVLNICSLAFYCANKLSLFGAVDQATAGSSIHLPQKRSRTKSFTLLALSQENNTELYRRELVAYCLSTKKKQILLFYNSSFVSFRTWYIMCPWKIHPQWNCLNSRSSADVTGTVSAEGDLDWCGIWQEGNGSPLSVRKLSVKCCHCIKACLWACMPVCTRLGICVHALCGTCMSLYKSVCIYASLSWGYWSWEQHAESVAANRNR